MCGFGGDGSVVCGSEVAVGWVGDAWAEGRGQRAKPGLVGGEVEGDVADCAG